MCVYFFYIFYNSHIDELQRLVFIFESTGTFGGVSACDLCHRFFLFSFG